MYMQFLIGGAVVVGTVLIQALIIGGAIRVLNHVGIWLIIPPTFIKFIITLSGLVLWLVFGLAISCFLWAFTYVAVGAITMAEPAIYFAIVTFTTLGYGDITLSEQWRLLAAITALNGLIIVGLNTAFLIEALTRVRDAQEKMEHKNIP